MCYGSAMSNDLSPRAQQILPGLQMDPDGLDYAATAPPRDAPRYTAAEFLRREPDKAQKVVDLLGIGCGQRRAAELVGCSVHTVRAVLAELPEDVATARRAQLTEFRRLTALGLEALAEKLSDPAELAKLSPLQLATVIGILDDHSKGQAPASVTVNINAPSADDLNSYLSRLQAADPAEPGETDLPGESGGTKGTLPGPPAGEAGQILDVQPEPEETPGHPFKGSGIDT